MNQILSTNNNNNNDYKSVDTRKIIKIFCISVVAIAVLIISIIGFNWYKESANQVEEIKPEILIEQIAEKVKISAQCEEGISKIKYSWNNGDETEIPYNGETTIEEEIDLPEGDQNYLDVYVTSSKEVTSRSYQTFTKELDISKPTIDYAQTIEDSTLTVVAKDEKEMDYLQYHWDGEETVKIEASEEGVTTLEAKIKVSRGSRKLYIQAADKSGNVQELSRIVTGVNQPEVEAIRYGGKVNIKVYHDMGFKRIEYIINNKIYVYDEEYAQYDKELTEIELEFPIQEGENTVVVKAYSLEKYAELTTDDLTNYSTKIFKGKCTYEPDEE